MANFQKILIANRGEIAVRIIKTARALGYRTVAVYSDVDADSLHVESADEAVCIGPGPVGQSYLVADQVLQAAKLTGADAVHPGYGFLSENTDFAAACEAAGVTFIGPPAAAIELMGSKRLSKIAMLEAGVPCIPGYQDAEQSDAVLIEKAQDVGFPLMVKASAGGGGRGMRLVHSEAELPDLIKTARSEAQNAFGSGELILERAVLEPRHIEIQVFADNHGNVVYLGERDCSIQRRHQKVVEEAPSPFVDEDLRSRMGEAAVSAARACDYRGAGTVEFLVDKDRNFYFLEMNTRLQVEHPVTEMITGQDLVAWQITVAAGDRLPLQQAEIQLSGHAVEVRLYAEDPRNNFLPQTGRALVWEYPQGPGIRVDHGLAQGQQISPFYDPMIAKLIAHGDDRDQACRKLASAVQDSSLLGVNNNKLFLQNILRHPVFLEGAATTAFIEQHFQDDPSVAEQAPPAASLAMAAVVLFANGNCSGTGAGWHNPTAANYHYRLEVSAQQHDVYLLQNETSYSLRVGEEAVEVELCSMTADTCVVVRDGVRSQLRYSLQRNCLYLDDGMGHFVFDNMTHAPAAVAGGVGSGEVKASMDGAIIEVMVAAGDVVEPGQTLVVLEAMKMEHPLKAAVAGTIALVSTSVGEQVKSRQLLVTISEHDAE